MGNDTVWSAAAGRIDQLMAFIARIRRVKRFLAIAGAFPGWAVPFYIVVFAFGACSRGDTDSAVFAALLIAPILSGTGLFTMAREGRTDLLFGTGVSVITKQDRRRSARPIVTRPKPAQSAWALSPGRAVNTVNASMWLGRMVRTTRRSCTTLPR